MRFIEFHKIKVIRGEKVAGTVINYYRAFKLFCEMNDFQLSWKKISKGLPKARKSSNDRAPTLDEIKKLIEYPDRRIRPIIFVMCSSGIRLGAWDYLKWKDVVPIHDEENEIIAAKLVVYRGEPEEYYSFITPEAYNAVKEWMNFRISYGEVITNYCHDSSCAVTRSFDSKSWFYDTTGIYDAKANTLTFVGNYSHPS